MNKNTLNFKTNISLFISLFFSTLSFIFSISYFIQLKIKVNSYRINTAEFDNLISFIETIKGFIGFLIVVFFIISSLIIFHIYKTNIGLFKNLNYINEKIKFITMGNDIDISAENLFLSSNAEIIELSKGFDIIEQNINSLIFKIKQGAFSIRESVETLNMYNNNLANKSEEQYLKVESIDENLIQIKKIVNFNNINTQKLNKLTKKTKKIIEIINIESDNLNKTINQIFNSSEQIEKISTSIEELSFQTTILSLNSAVESTRIQNGAKSFDVISNEIHKLSTMGKNAAKEIKNLSNENRIKIDESTFYLHNTVNLIDTLVNKINEISTLLDEITIDSQSEFNEISKIMSSLLDIKSSTQQTNKIAKDTLLLNENLNNESIHFLEIIDFFNNKNVNPNFNSLISTITTEEILNDLTSNTVENFEK
ncbi:MAG: hypothetical protein KBE24_05410 [Fusobacteriaceae bacterium]|nr:hypothetical protein [Fusobacteriaceae bacterium]